MINTNDVFKQLEKDRDSGEITRQLMEKHAICYQASQDHPGKIEAVDRDGIITIGEFRNGLFVPT